MFFVTKQPVESKYVMVAEPAETPETTPPVFTVATAALLLNHTPPPTIFE
jgi:hypothetical protein